MTKKIDFYFDFISPYSYLAHKRIIGLNNRDKFNYKAILLGGLHNLGGITAPAFNERKMKNMRNDCMLIAEKNKIDFTWNEKFPINSLYLMRGYLFINHNKKDKFFDVCFDAYWKNNEDISNGETIKNILFSDFKGEIKSLGAWGGDFILASSSELTTDYFRNKGYNDIFKYNELIMNQ